MAISGLASLRVPIHLSEAEKHERLKQQVLAGIEDTNALLVNSDESYSLHKKAAGRSRS